MYTKIDFERMREARILAGLTLQKLSNITGIPVTCLCEYERGVSRVSMERLFLICKAVRLMEEELIWK